MEQETGRRRIQRPKQHFPWLFLSILLVAGLLVISILIWRIDVSRRNTPVTEPTEARTLQEGDTLTIAAAGDINISADILNSAKRPDYSYDFSEMLMSVAPLLSDADITVADLECNFVDGIYDGVNNNAPVSLLEALAGAGVDVLQTANTVSVYNGVSGLISTVQAVENAGMTPVGTFISGDQYKKTGGFTMVEVNGFRVAFVAFTKGLGNLNLPEGADYCLNLLYDDYATTYQEVNREGIRAVLANVAQAQPDVTVALLHWGSEYDDEISETQEEIRDLMFAGGVDAILGTHSHLVDRVEFADGKVTAYNLGNLLSTSYNGRNQGIILKLNFAVKGGAVTLTDVTYDPIYLASEKETVSGRMEVLNTNNIISLYESQYITRVPDSIYESLCRSRDRIAELVWAQEEDN